MSNKIPIYTYVGEYDEIIKHYFNSYHTLTLFSIIHVYKYMHLFKNIHISFNYHSLSPT